MGPVEVMLRWTISLQINFLLSNAYMKCWLNFTRTFPRNTHVLAALAILLTGLSSMEPGAKKRGGGDLLGLSGTAASGHMLAPKGRQTQSSHGGTQSSLAIPAFNLST